MRGSVGRRRVEAGGDLFDRSGDSAAITRRVFPNVHSGRRTGVRNAGRQQPLQDVDVMVVGTNQPNLRLRDNELCTRPEDPGQRRAGRQSLLQTVPVRAELEGHPTEQPTRLQQQTVDVFTESRTGPSGPHLTLDDTVTDDAHFVGVQLDDRAQTAGQHPLAVTLVDEVLIARPLGQRAGQFGDQVGGVTQRAKPRKATRRLLLVSTLTLGTVSKLS
jgi:hypothetical protein